MKINILVIHGAGVRAYKIMQDKWVPHLQNKLGSGFELILPKMPYPQFPQYQAWRETIKKTVKKIKGPIILIGHSLGGTVLLKYLSEEEIPNPIFGFYMIASPFFSPNLGWNYQDYYLADSISDRLSQFPIYSYHSTDDKIVPVDHQSYLSNLIPKAVIRTLSGHGHEFDKKEFQEIIQDIKAHHHHWHDLHQQLLHPPT